MGPGPNSLCCLFIENGRSRAVETDVETLLADFSCQALILVTSAAATNSIVFGHHFG
jgi:hypothetical protein